MTSPNRDHRASAFRAGRTAPGRRAARSSRRARMLVGVAVCAVAAVSAGAPPSASELSLEQLRALRRANNRVQRGNAYMAEGQNRRAEHEYQEALELFPQHVDALYNLAVLYRDSDRTAAARESYERLLSIQPDSADAMTCLGDLYDEEGDPAKAESLYRRAIEANPRFGRAYNNLGFLLQKRARRPEAVEAFSAYVALEEEKERPDPYGYYNLGCAWLENGDPVRAKDVLLKAADSLPDDPLVNNALGNVYVVQGLHTQALLRFRRAQKAAPAYPPVWEGLGDVYAGRGEPDRAAEMYEKAVQLRPDYASAHLKLGRLLQETSPKKALLHFRAYLRYGTVSSFREEAENACRELADGER